MDFITDQSGRHLSNINEKVTVPEYVKQASMDTDELAALPLISFADPVKKEFPINNKAHVFLSYGYCKSAGVKNVRVLDRIKKAAVVLGMEKDLEMVDAGFGPVKQASAPERRYAVMIDFDSEKSAAVQGTHGFYPLDSEDGIIESARSLDNDKNRLPLCLYVDGCREVVKAAREVGLGEQLIPERVRLYGNEHFPNFEHVKWAAGRREMATGDSSYAEIANAAEANEENLSMDKYAALWELADASNGVKYSASTPDPYRVFNVGTSKQAYDAALDQHVVLAGAVVPVEAIGHLDAAEVAKWFPKGAAVAVGDLIKLARVGGDEVLSTVSTLTPAMQKTLLRLVIAE